MKILAFADIHIGNRLHGQIDSKTGLNTREIDTLNLIDKITDYAVDNNIETIVFAGDMYKNNLPTPTLQNEVNRRIKRGVDKGLTFLLLDGNHDTSKMEMSSSALKSFDTFEIDRVIHTRFHREYIHKLADEQVKFVFLPTYHTQEEIEQIVNETAYNIPTVFIFHGTLSGANLNEWLIAEKETYIDSKVFHKEGIRAVVCGHLHMHQIINKEPLIFYTGSTQRVDFNEEHQPKGFVVFDTDTLNYDFIELESQTFLTIKLDLLSEINIEETILQEVYNNSDKIKNSVIRIKLNLEEGSRFNERKVYETLKQLGAKSILDIQKTFNYKKTIRNHELNENMSIEKGLEFFYKGKTREKERIELGKKIIQFLEENE